MGVVLLLGVLATLTRLITPSAGDDHSHEHAFLGEYAESVLGMKPQELEDLLYWLVEQRIDQNKDMKLSTDELQHWMRHVYHRDLENNILEAFNTANVKGDNDISFKEYRQWLFTQPDTPQRTEKSENRLVARWRLADDNGDGRLSLGEFGVFYAPDEAHHKKMHGLLVDEYIEDRDTNGDYILSFNEWAGPIVGEDDVGTGQIWKMEMKARFKDADENNDGELHHPEVEHFLFPLEEDREADEEAIHILAEVDDDGDGLVSHHEMMKHLRIFVGSQVLQHGKLFHAADEL